MAYSFKSGRAPSARFDQFAVGERRNRAFFRRTDGACGVCKIGRVAQLGFVDLGNGLAGLHELCEERAEEAVAGAGGIDDFCIVGVER